MARLPSHTGPPSCKLSYLTERLQNFVRHSSSQNRLSLLRLTACKNTLFLFLFILFSLFNYSPEDTWSLNIINVNGEKTIVVGNFVKHPFHDGSNFDLAIIRLNSPLSWAVPFSIDSRPLNCGEPLKGMGYGRTSNQTEPKPTPSFTDNLLSIFGIERAKAHSNLQIATVIVQCDNALRTKLTNLYNWFRGKAANEDWIITLTPGVTLCWVG